MPTKSITVLKFKIVQTKTSSDSEKIVQVESSSDSENASTQADILEDLANLMRQARNAAAEDWLLRQRGKPESDRQCKHFVKGKYIDDPTKKPKNEATKLYHAIVERFPQIGTKNVPMLAAQINTYLNAKVDWRTKTKDEKGKQRKRSDAILSYEDRIPCFTAMEIPVHNEQCDLTMGDELTLKIKRVTRDVEYVQVKLSLRRIGPAIKTILHELTRKERKLSDSKILKTSKGWFWYLPVGFEQSACDPEKEITLKPIVPENDGDPERPFVVSSGSHKRNIGDGRYLRRQTLRIESAIKQVGYRYKQQRKGAGHGRKKIDQSLSRRRRTLSNCVDECRRRMILDAVNYARRNEAGTVIYRKPSGPVKEKCWFDVNGLTWDWTRFESDLKNSLAKHGIQLKTKDLKMKEVLGKK